jgi:hypothetical protein
LYKIHDLIKRIFNSLLKIGKLSVAVKRGESLNANQKHDRVLASQAILDQFFSEGSFGIFKHLVTLDETWINMCNPETKEQSKKWKYSGSPCPKKLKTQKSSSKVLVSVFGEKD